VIERQTHRHTDKNKKKILHRPRSIAWELILFQVLNPIKLAYNPSRPAYLTDWVSVHANNHGDKAYCYAELAISSPAEAVTVVSTRYAYPLRGGQAELS